MHDKVTRATAKKRPGKQPDMSFPWLRNLNDFLVGSLRNARGFDAREYLQQLSDQGFTHVTINGLGVEHPFESGPPGEVYSWFYDYSPDLDQFVASTLLKGFYPAEYLKTNLEFLKRNAALALEHRLIPGLHINSPRSMPESFWKQYPYLRGARVDHPRESFLPRYTLAMAHPAAQLHYRELVRAIMREIPQLGFIHVWTNDSGAGFEFTSSLYAGRNGGPYLLREWKSDEEIERKASENVLTYYRLLRDEARAVNPHFRFVCDLGPFYKERLNIIRGLDDGMDAGSFGYFEGPTFKEESRELKKAGAWTHAKVEIADNNVLGVPYPRLVYERLMDAVRRGDRGILTNTTPRSHAPYDINGEVLRAVQFRPHESIDDILHAAAAVWVGEDQAEELVRLWSLSDRAVRSYPTDIPYSTFAFPWFRLWVRPFVPNIDAIPESERAYYERYLIATFNNPTRVDLNNDMMWNFLSVKQAGKRRSVIDRKVLPLLRKGIDRLSRKTRLGAEQERQPGKDVFEDLNIRFRAAHCYYSTMRAVVAWIEGVHGYLEARTQREKEHYRAWTHSMVRHEIENTKELLQLWNTSPVEFIPIARSGESPHIYGKNFGKLLEKKIRLMEAHKDDEPYIDPDYMWRMRVDSVN